MLHSLHFDEGVQASNAQQRFFALALLTWLCISSLTLSIAPHTMQLMCMCVRLLQSEERQHPAEQAASCPDCRRGPGQDPDALPQ